METPKSDSGNSAPNPPSKDSFRFHVVNSHLNSTFGNNWFARKAESFARLFGTPVFLGTQTLIVILWITANALGLFMFDVYPFILLNLAFSVQAAYAAPLILLAQTRQADRDKLNAEADARHREDLAQASQLRQEIAEKSMEQMFLLLKQNTELTEITKKLSERIEGLTEELHTHIIRKN